jgi:hypothetical protein
MTKTTQQERDRQYKLLCFPITEERRIGLIDFRTCMQRMKEAHQMVYGSQIKESTDGTRSL